MQALLPHSLAHTHSLAPTHRVEVDGVHCEDVRPLPVALEREVPRLLAVVHVVHRHAALNAAHQVARAVGEGGHAAGLVLERGGDALKLGLGGVEGKGREGMGGTVQVPRTVREGVTQPFWYVRRGLKELEAVLVAGRGGGTGDMERGDYMRE